MKVRGREKEKDEEEKAAEREERGSQSRVHDPRFPSQSYVIVY